MTERRRMNRRAFVDPREAFLARAAARELLYSAGEMTLDGAIEGLLDTLEILRPCTCAREIFERLDREAAA